MDAEMLVKTHWALARLRHRPAQDDMAALAGAARRLVRGVFRFRTST
jgi:hypothetical protein